MCPPENIKNNSDTDDLIKEGETKEDLANGPIDDFLKLWVNKHLKAAGHPKENENFGDDLKDGEVYTILLNNIFPEDCDKSPLDENDINHRLFVGEIYNVFSNPYNVNEKECYCKIINKMLENDEELKNKLPINEKIKSDIDLLYQVLKPIVKEEAEELLTLDPEDFLKIIIILLK